MKYFVLVLLVALVHCDENYVPRNRQQVALSFQACMPLLGITRAQFKSIKWDLNSDNDVVQKMVKCMVKEMGLYDDSLGFNTDRMVKQFGGESVRERVKKCIVDNPIDATIVEKSVQTVMNCLENDGLKMYRDSDPNLSQ